jgi:hypothetical protein
VAGSVRRGRLPDCGLGLSHQYDLPHSLGLSLRLRFWDKWAARGCDPKVLAKIRKDVFDIGVLKPQARRQRTAEAGLRPPPLLLNFNLALFAASSPPGLTLLPPSATFPLV